MYHLTISGQSERFATLMEAFAFCDDRPLCPDTTTLISERLDDLSVTILHGRLSIRILGSAAEVVRRLFREVRDEYIFDGIRQREPYEVEPRFWRLIRRVLGLTHEPQRIFSQEQIATFSLVKGGLWAIANDVLKEMFGFDNGGPVCVGTEGRSLNHSDHLGAALLVNVPVAKTVIDAFKAEPDDQHFYGWIRLLINVPELRGTLPVDHIRFLASLGAKGDMAASSSNAARLISLLQPVDRYATIVELDDLLYEAGLLHVAEVSDLYAPQRYVGVPISPVAEVIQRYAAEDKRRSNAARVDVDRAGGRYSKRSVLTQHKINEADHKPYSFKWANDIAGALAERDMKRLLYKLDLPDSMNRSSKLALEETLGVKLVGLRANARRRALFAMCCFDEVQQLRIEADIGGTVTKQRLLCAKVIAWKRAASTTYSQPDGETLNGAEHVERAIAEGCTDLLVSGRGASKRYRLAREGGLAAPVRAKDGTLDYARFLLAAV